MGLCPPGGVRLDAGGRYHPTPLQKKMGRHWRTMIDDWLPVATRGEPFILVHNGDAIEGDNPKSRTQISRNMADQGNIAYGVLAELVDKAEAYYQVRGTEWHVGPSAQEEERLAQRLGAIPDDTGAHARYQLWIDLDGHLCHFAHHIGTTSSSSYEATAVAKELVEAYVESGRWGDPPPQVIARSHRHRYMEVRQCGSRGMFSSYVSPGWQLKTAFGHKMNRLSEPQLGAILIRRGKEELYTRPIVWGMRRDAPEMWNA